VERARSPLEHRLVELETRKTAAKYRMVLKLKQRSLESRAPRQQLRLQSLVCDLRLVKGGYGFEGSLNDLRRETVSGVANFHHALWLPRHQSLNKPVAA
jgi:hypothetical protein